jgi:uncharacterized protein YggE
MTKRFCAAVLVVLTSGCSTYVTAHSLPTERTVTVGGTASVDVVPDEACVELTLTTRDAAMPAAHASLASASAELSKELQSQSGLVVERGAVSYSPEYDVESGRSHLARYAASNQINVRLRDFARIPDVIGRAAHHELDRVSVVYYSTTIAAKKAEVRAHALEAANDKARAMTSALGVSLGDVVTVVEGEGHANGGTGSNSYLERASVDRASDIPAPPGAVPLSVSVNVVYRLR